mgnify:FL=1
MCKITVKSRVFLLLALTLGCAIYIAAGTSITPFHGDESTQIFMSRDYAYLFIEGDLSRIAYHQPPLSAQEQELRLLNGTVAKNLFGLAWQISGFSVDEVNQQWDWGADWNYNQSTGHAPPDSMLQAARIPSMLLLIAGLIPMLYLGFQIGGWGGAAAAVILYTLNPALLLNGRRAMMEGALIVFSLLTVAAGVLWMRRHDWRSALLLGTAAGLAIASKHPAVFTVGVVFVVCGIDALIRRRGLLRLIAAALTAGAVFFLLNPAWWSDPIGAAGELIRLRSNLLAGQAAAFGGYPSTVDAFGGFFRQTFGWMPQYFEIDSWSSYIGDQIARYESSGLAGVIGGVMPFLVGLMAALGAFALIHRVGDRSVRMLIGAWAAVMFASALISPLEWQRYYLSAILAVIVLSAGGIGWIVRAIHLYRSSR